jgi:hypothetical protein
MSSYFQNNGNIGLIISDSQMLMLNNNLTDARDDGFLDGCTLGRE